MKNVFFFAAYACLFTLTLITLTHSALAQTYNGGGGVILDDGSDNYYIINVSGLSPANIDTSYGLETVCINLVHTYDDDLTISLIAPDSTEFILTSHMGGGNDNYTNTCFNNDDSVYIGSGSAPFTGSFRPIGSMAVVNNGQNGNGVWKLHILDTYPYADAGALLNWSITFGHHPARPFPFYGTRLPLVIINTGGIPIPDEPKVMVDLHIVHKGNGQWNTVNDTANVYDGLAGIEIRGSSSSGMPKKSYNFETRFADSTDRNVSLLSMPQESDWVLLANYADKSLLRNYMTYFLYNRMGRWAPRMEVCELVVDGEYQGLYLLGEKIKRDNDRVDIASLSPTDSTPPTITGGYIFKVDWVKSNDFYWTSNYPAILGTNNLNYILVYPKKEDLHNDQLKYIKSYVDTFEYVMRQPWFADTALGYRKYIDEASFIDYIILTEFVKNVDGYRLSTFFYKDRNGKIHAGPPWDYDLTWGNADYMECYYPGGWAYEVQATYTNQCPFYWPLFFKDSLFMEHLKCRWEDLKQNIYDPAVIKYEIDSLVQIMDSSVRLNFKKWPILGTYVWPNPAPIPHDYPGEIQKLKDWADMRFAWLDNNWPLECPNASITETEPIKGESYVLFPNPSSGMFTLYTSRPEADEILQLELSNAGGTVLWKGQSASNEKISLPDGIANGVYLFRITDHAGSSVAKLVVLR